MYIHVRYKTGKTVFIWYQVYIQGKTDVRRLLTLLEPQSRFGDKPAKLQVVFPPKPDCGSKRGYHNCLYVAAVVKS